MIVRRFLAWTQNATAEARAQATSALARAYLQSELSPQERHEAEIAMTALLDDPSLSVRRALSLVLAGSETAPRHIISALAADHPDVSEEVLAQSPLLSDVELLDIASQGDAGAQCAIARRATLSTGLLTRLIEICRLQAAIVLSSRPETAEACLRRLLERFPDAGALRETVLARGDTSAVLRGELVSAAASTLSAFVTENAWLPRERAARTTRDAIERAHLLIASDAGPEGTPALRDFVRHLRRSGQLTAGFLLRALLTGHRGLCVAALADLSGLPTARVSGILQNPASSGFSALLERAGLASTLLPAFRAAFLKSVDENEGSIPAGQLSRPMIERALAACGGVGGTGRANVEALLRRFETEAARDDARHAARRLAEPAPREIFIDLDALEAEIALAA